MQVRGCVGGVLGILLAAVAAGASASDTKPNAFSLVNATVYKGSRALPDATHVTRAITVQGIDAASPISISGPGEYNVNGGSFRTSKATVKKGDKVVVRVKASSTYDEIRKATLNIGGVSASFALQTIRGPSATLSALDDSTSIVYRRTERADLHSFVYKPQDWKSSDRRTAMVCYFGGSWYNGDPGAEIPSTIVRWAASQGMVGITPDYRVNERFANFAVDCVDDARAAMRWVQDHHAELGIDPHRIVACGSSVGAHSALWTGIPKTPPGSDADSAPLYPPAASILLSAVTDSSPKTGFRPERFGSDTLALAYSPKHQLPPYLPPVLMFHGTADKTVAYAKAEGFCDTVRASGNDCSLVTIRDGVHTWFRDDESERGPALDKMKAFLRERGLLAGP